MYMFLYFLKRLNNFKTLKSNEIDKTIVNKELEIIKAEIINSGKPKDMVEKSLKEKLKNISRSLYLEKIAGNILYNQNNTKSFLKGLQIPAW